MSIEYVILIVALIAIAVLIVYFLWKRSLHIPNAVETEGEIVDIEEFIRPGINPLNTLRGKYESEVKFHPVVRFKLDKEKRVRFRNRKGYSDRGQYQVGDQVKVLYSENNPLIAKIKED